MACVMVLCCPMFVYLFGVGLIVVIVVLAGVFVDTFFLNCFNLTSIPIDRTPCVDVAPFDAQCFSTVTDPKTIYMNLLRRE